MVSDVKIQCVYKAELKHLRIKVDSDVAQLGLPNP